MKATRQFICALHEDIRPDELIEVRGFRDGRKNVRLFSSDVDELIAWVEKYRDEYNLYIGVNARATKGGTNEAVKRSYWVWIDIDAKKVNDIPSDKILKSVMSRIVLPPHMIVYTGGGVHLYYRTVGTEDLKLVQRVCNALAAEINGDPLGDAARIFRLPGTYNFKYGEPREVTLHHCMVDFEYPFEDILGAVSLPVKMARRVDIGDGRGYASRSERDWAVIRALMIAGLAEDTVRYIFEKRSIGDKFREEGDKYLEHSLTRARESIGGETEVVDTGVPQVGGEPVKTKKVSKRTLHDKWTIVNSDDCMFAVDPDGAMKQLSTFAMEPRVLLQGDMSDNTEDTILCNVRAAGYTWESIPFTRSAFNRVDTLTRQLPAMAWQWLGGDADVRRLLPHLMDQLRNQGLPKRKGTPVIGVHGKEFVGPTQTLCNSGILDPDAARMVWLPTRRVHPKVKFVWAQEDEVQAMLREFLDLYFKVNERHIVYSVLGWYTAAFVKDKLLKANVRFPILNVFGTRGSGKTSLITGVMQPLFCYEEPVAWDFNSTKFVMLSLLGSTNAVPISFAEYRRTSTSNDQLERYIRLSYDLGEDSRGKPDQTTQNYTLHAPFTVDGEDSISDPACMERIVQVSLHPETIAEGTEAYTAFQLLRELPLGIIGTRLIAWLLDYEPDFEEALTLTKEVFTGSLPDRVRRNLAVTTVGLQAFASFVECMELEFPRIDAEFLASVLTPALDNVVNQATGRTSLMVDEFIEDVVSAVAMSVDQRPPGFIFRYESGVNLLYMNLTTALRWWFQKRMREHQPVLDSAAMKQQLRERMPTNGNDTEPGFYILAPTTKAIDGRPSHVYPIDIAMAEQTGLDVPSRLTQGIY
jgi:hypothetical protein